MEKFLILFIAIPLLGFIINALTPKDNEKLLAQLSYFSMGLQFIAVLLFSIVWLIKGGPTLYSKELIIFNTINFEIFIDFCYDKFTATYLIVGSFIAFLITTYSRNYLHKELGFKRFFTTILFFYLGYNIIVLSGNLTTIFVGWEVAGISSFLLIAYYRNRYLPVRNAVKIFALYRIGDIAMILAMWFSHHIWHKSISLLSLENSTDVNSHIASSPTLALLFSLFILLAALIKSAQFPFSSWLPRALEGPTPSSAIFYSSLSVHLGVLLLLRTFPFWSNILIIKIIVIGIGLFTFLISIITARVQPSIKGQIAYSGIAQIGLMFIEVALGWHNLVLVHFTSNALLRSYQLLVSPSIVTYLIREQFYLFTPFKRKKIHPILQNIVNSIYILSLLEWHMDSIMHHLTWNTFKQLGKRTLSVNSTLAIIIGLIIPVSFCFINLFHNELNNYLAITLFILAFTFALRAFTETKSLQFAWVSLGITQLNISIAMYLQHTDLYFLSMFSGGILLAFILGYIAIIKLMKKEDVDLIGYQGHCYEHSKIESLFLVASLAMFGFPITTAFLGIELLYGSLAVHQISSVVFLSLTLLVISIAIIRMYARVFLGPHTKTYHESARRSS